MFCTKSLWAVSLQRELARKSQTRGILQEEKTLTRREETLKLVKRNRQKIQKKTMMLIVPSKFNITSQQQLKPLPSSPVLSLGVSIIKSCERYQ